MHSTVWHECIFILHAIPGFTSSRVTKVGGSSCHAKLRSMARCINKEEGKEAQCNAYGMYECMHECNECLNVRVYHEAINVMLQLYTHHILHVTCSYGTCECMHECNECMRTTILKPFHSYA